MGIKRPVTCKMALVSTLVWLPPVAEHCSLSCLLLFIIKSPLNSFSALSLSCLRVLQGRPSILARLLNGQRGCTGTLRDLGRDTGWTEGLCQYLRGLCSGAGWIEGLF